MPAKILSDFSDMDCINVQEQARQAVELSDALTPPPPPPPLSLEHTGHMRMRILKDENDLHPMDLQGQACQASCASCTCWRPTPGASRA